MNVNDLKRQAVLTECARHIAVLHKACIKLNLIFPLKIETFSAVSELNLETLDQFVYRITKLQDAMGTRLFPIVASLLYADDKPRPFLDVLHTLEKFDLITSTHDWQDLRNLRNNLAHEYSNSVEQMVNTLNMLFNNWHKLEQSFDKINNFFIAQN